MTRRPQRSGAGSLLAPAADTAGIWLAGGAGHLLVTDPLGRRIGYLGTERVNEIPGARADDIPGGLGTPLEPMYTVPAGQEYKILLTGTRLRAIRRWSCSMGRSMLQRWKACS